jgi:PIN domain nuclease of toxin-antitoxin system
MDTHVWVWASDEASGPRQLEASVLSVIESAARRRKLFASAASVWELALKVERGEALLSGDLHAWVRDQMRYPGVRLRSVDARLAIDSTLLPRWTRVRDGREHRDPADRFIVATARRLNATLLTCDNEVLAYAANGHLKAYDACRMEVGER